MQLALWDRPPAGCLRKAAESQGLLVECHDAARCASLLLEDQVDVALLPTTLAVVLGKAVTVLPEAAVSAWTYPFAHIALRRGIGRVASLSYPPDSTQELLMARIVLQEHYGQQPAVVPRSGSAAPSDDHDAVLMIGPEGAPRREFGTIFDLGQEWYELAQYPMVWGLFVTRSGRAAPHMVSTVRDVAREAEVLAGRWPESPAFHASSLRLRYDDVTTASLTRITEYLFYYKVTGEITEIPLYATEQQDSNVPWWAS